MEHVPVDGAPVFFLLHPRMNRQTGDGIAIVDFHQTGEFRRVLDSQPGLDGYRQMNLGEYFIKKAVQPVGVCQKSGALALGGDGAGGAAQVQIDLSIAHLFH